jgi:hypothetical protein
MVLDKINKICSKDKKIVIFMTRPSNPRTGTAIVLYIFGIALVITAIIVLLKGTGVLSFIPSYVVWALVLLTLGLGILGGLNNLKNR